MSPWARVTTSTMVQARRASSVVAVMRTATRVAMTRPQKSMTASACIHETKRGSKPVRAGRSASPECGPEPVTIGAEEQHDRADGARAEGERPRERVDDELARARDVVAGAAHERGRQRDEHHREQEVRHDGPRVESGQDGDAAEDGLGGDAGEDADRDAVQPAALRPVREHDPQRGEGEHGDDARQRAVAELDEVVELALGRAHRGERPRLALRPRAAPEPAAGEAHDAAGDDDADLADEVGEQERPHPAGRDGGEMTGGPGEPALAGQAGRRRSR